MSEFLSAHALEIFTTVLGLFYIYFEYHASIWLWPIGILMPAIDVYLFATSGLYAYAGISVVFTAVAVWGLWQWRHGGARQDGRSISFMPVRVMLISALATAVLTALVHYVLITFTDSQVAVLDSLTTALSLVAVVALALKFVEQWLLWVLVDAISVVLLMHQGLFVRSGLYALYVGIAIMGYCKWKQMARCGQ